MMKSFCSAGGFQWKFLLVVVCFLMYQLNFLNVVPEAMFKTYQDRSEALVLGKIYGDVNDKGIPNANLGFINRGGKDPSDVLAVYLRLDGNNGFTPLDITDANWAHGFATFGPKILFGKSAAGVIGVGENEFRVGQKFALSNGQTREVIGVENLGQYIHLTYSGDLLNPNALGDRNITLSPGDYSITPYPKQFGVQAIFLSKIWEIFPSYFKKIFWLQALSSLFFSIAVVVLTFQISQCIDKKFGTIFFLCMLGSPWVISFARNLYWVPFLWLLPVITSFIYVNYVKKYSYSFINFIIFGVVSFLTFFLKSLAGYEYLPIIVIFSMLPFLLEIVKPIKNRIINKPYYCLLVNFLASIFGFMAALTMHAGMRAGSILEGIKETLILEGFKYNFIGSIANSPKYTGIDDSYIHIFDIYVSGWRTPIIFGFFEGMLFPILFVVSLLTVVLNFIIKSEDRYKNFIIWSSALICSCSWSILMPMHSAIHTHLNFILWYFFFIPAAFYLVFIFFTSPENLRCLTKWREKNLNTCSLEKFELIKTNNFTLLRFILALSVMFGHSFPIVGKGSDPISVYFLQPRAWVGAIAVEGFFFISGFLVVGSFVRRGAVNYLLSRALRLYPAIILYTSIVVFIVGPLFFEGNVFQYLATKPWLNFYNVPLWEWNYNILNIFNNNTLAGSTNGSAWTLPVELRCYLLLFLMGIFGVLDSRVRANFASIGLLIIAIWFFKDFPVFGLNERYRDPLIYFITGSLFWLNKDLIPLTWKLLLICMTGAFFAIHYGMFYLYLPFFMGYMMLYFVYKCPAVNLDKYGDLSYGVYIYAWVAQQIVWVKDQNPYTNFILALCIVLPISYFSWHFVESPALLFRKKLKGSSFVPSFLRQIAK